MFRRIAPRALLILLMTLGATEAPARGLITRPPRPVTDADLVPAVDAQFEPALASNGRGYVAVWSDFWSGGWDLEQTHIFGVALDARGSTELPRRYLLHGIDPAIATDGVHYLMAAGALCDWQGVCPAGIPAALLDESASPRRLVQLNDHLPGAHSDVSVAWSEGRYLVTWITRTEGAAAQLFGALLDGLGETVIEPKLLLAGIVDAAATPAARGFVLSWIGLEGGVNTASVSADGVLGSPRRAAEAAHGPITAAFNGREHALAFRTGNRTQLLLLAADGAVIRSTLLDRNGEVALLGVRNEFVMAAEHSDGSLVWQTISSQSNDPPERTVSYVRHPNAAPAPALATDGASVVLAFASGREGIPFEFLDSVDVRTTSILGSGYSAEVITLAARRQEPAGMACDGSACLAFWYEPGGVRYALEDFARSNPASEGALLWPAPDASQFLLDVAFNGAVYLAVWSETSRTGSWLLARRFDRQGQPVDAEPLVLPLPHYDLRAATDGKDFLLISRELGERDRLVAVRLRGSGTLLDSHPFELLPGRQSQRAFAIAHDGTRYHLGWIEILAGGFGVAMAARLDNHGQLLSSPVSLTTNPDRLGEIAIAATPSHRMVSWTVRENPFNFNRKLRGVWLDSEGRPAGEILDLTDNSAFVSGPRLVPLDSGLAVLWHRSPDDYSIDARVMLIEYGTAAAAPERILPSLLFGTVSGRGERIHILTRLFVPDLGNVTRVVIAEHHFSQTRPRPVRR